MGEEKWESERGRVRRGKQKLYADTYYSLTQGDGSELEIEGGGRLGIPA